MVKIKNMIFYFIFLKLNTFIEPGHYGGANLEGGAKKKKASKKSSKKSSKKKSKKSSKKKGSKNIKSFTL